MSKQVNVSVVWLPFAIGTAMVGHTIHGGAFWTIMNFIFAPLSWAKWLICQDVTLTIIKKTFSFFLQ